VNGLLWQSDAWSTYRLGHKLMCTGGWVHTPPAGLCIQSRAIWVFGMVNQVPMGVRAQAARRRNQWMGGDFPCGPVESFSILHGGGTGKDQCRLACASEWVRRCRTCDCRGARDHAGMLIFRTQGHT
jgi:hypothetical protein